MTVPCPQSFSIHLFYSSWLTRLKTGVYIHVYKSMNMFGSIFLMVYSNKVSSDRISEDSSLNNENYIIEKLDKKEVCT